ncbi:MULTISPECIES: hypothetical protein [Yersinia]|uniref:Uncharacterized protein n=1 Tax=Yersinia bercovieri TaxID=634 RepID=A0A2G4U719_YERBE|nr:MULTISPECIES: hypothetical protein [Yersinia]MCB5303260.1 hypothetical protein [Yersinia bercovieri]MDN0102198.1 hypothetical protein [Yersinia bercovieri]PHZ28546.1 hypothetical protein CS533_04440 [Yersinia bercovieri]QDW32931.1 hypothetical protein FFE93_007565 [Yersinia sp. KBS0713]QKJ08722.1 hypothetical protein HRK25_18645 [Yersinia bercovieri ATCC 43970]
MNNTIKYLLLFLATATIPTYASACELAGESPEECQSECMMAEDFETCVLGSAQNPNSDTTPTVTMQAAQPTSR